MNEVSPMEYDNSLKTCPASGEGRLFVVGTPIGNLGDASRRMVETLAGADEIMCEDTRVTQKLLSAFDLHVPLVRADENTLIQKIPATLEKLMAGARIAFVSDAGMPGVSDPGQPLVDACLEHRIPVEVIPGPSAAICALTLSGLPMEHFFFEGFLPRKAGAKKERLQLLRLIPAALVIYESPHRVVDTLEALAQVMPGRKVALVRELTKIHEEVVRDMPEPLKDMLEATAPLKGECVLVVAAPDVEELQALDKALKSGSSAGLLAGETDQNQPSLEEAIREGLHQGRPKTALAKQLSRSFGLNRSEVYDLVCEIARQGV